MVDPATIKHMVDPATIKHMVDPDTINHLVDGIKVNQLGGERNFANGIDDGKNRLIQFHYYD